MTCRQLMAETISCYVVGSVLSLQLRLVGTGLHYLSVTGG